MSFNFTQAFHVTGDTYQYLVLTSGVDVDEKIKLMANLKKYFSVPVEGAFIKAVRNVHGTVNYPDDGEASAAVYGELPIKPRKVTGGKMLWGVGKPNILVQAFDKNAWGGAKKLYPGIPWPKTYTTTPFTLAVYTPERAQGH